MQVVWLVENSLEWFVVLQEAHEGDVNAIKWGSTGRFFVTGGADRKLKMWEVHGGRILLNYTLATYWLFFQWVSFKFLLLLLTKWAVQISLENTYARDLKFTTM